MPYVNGQWQNPTTPINNPTQSIASPQQSIATGTWNQQTAVPGTSPAAGTGVYRQPSTNTATTPMAQLMQQILGNYGMPTLPKAAQPTAPATPPGVVIPSILSPIQSGVASRYYQMLAKQPAHAVSPTDIANAAAQQTGLEDLTQLFSTPGSVVSPSMLKGISPTTLSGSAALKGNVDPLTGRVVAQGGISAEDYALASLSGGLPYLQSSYAQEQVNNAPVVPGSAAWNQMAAAAYSGMSPEQRAAALGTPTKPQRDTGWGPSGWG